VIIGLVRHGQTDWNAVGRIQGQTDIPLNEEGIRQAMALGRRIASEDRKWDAAISSDLLRASKTAQIIADAIHVPLLPGDKRLRERYFGEMEGLTRSERAERWGNEWPVDHAVGIEPMEEVRARAHSFVEQWRQDRPNISLLVVSHGGLIAALLPVLCESIGEEHIGNLSYTILEWNNEGWMPLLYNCTAHV
jgi:2,3-bisphosphoglycerate-dependent phosphoglycerate mutase